MNKSLNIYVLDSAGELDFILPLLSTDYFLETKVKIIIQKNIYKSVKNTVFFDYYFEKYNIKVLTKLKLKLNLVIDLILNRDVLTGYGLLLPNSLQLILNKYQNLNLKFFPHSAFPYETILNYSRNRRKNIIADKISVLVQDKRYSKFIELKIGTKNFNYTGFFHSSDKFIKSIDEMSNKNNNWSEVVIFSYFPRDEFWPEKEFDEAHLITFEKIFNELPNLKQVSLKFHPRASNNVKEKYVHQYPKLKLTEENALLLSRKAKLVVCLGPSHVMYAPIHMKTQSIIFYNTASLLKNIRETDTLIDDKFNVNYYENEKDYLNKLDSMINSIFLNQPKNK